MVSFKTTFLALASAAAVAADYWIDPDSVSMSERKAWCNDQRTNCPIICLQTTVGSPIDNSCDPETLTYGCVCSDGRQPNMSEYTLTLPYHVCMRWGDQCVEACGSNNLCAADCREKHPCGAQSPKRVNATSTTTSASATATSTADAGQVFDGFGDGSSGDGEDDEDAAGQKGGAGMLRFGDSYGVALVAAGLFAGFVGFL